MKLLIIFSCVLVLNSIAFSQESANENWLQEIGFWPGFGYGNSTRNLPEGNYQPYFFLGHVAFKPFLKGQNTALEKFQFYMGLGRFLNNFKLCFILENFIIKIVIKIE